MSSASVSSTKHEKQPTDILLELDSIRSLNNTLRTYLDHIRLFRKNVAAMNNNCQQLAKVNSKWIDTLNNMK